MVDAMVDPKFGPVHTLEETMAATWSPAMHSWRAHAKQRQLDGSLVTVQGLGFDLDPMQAQISAIGEVVERSAARELLPHVPDVAPPDDAEIWLNFFSDEQHAKDSFPFADTSDIIDRRWTNAYRVDGTPVSVPRELTQMVGLTSAETRPIMYTTSSGIAAATSADDAALRALFELVERDALMTAWRLQVDSPRVRLLGTASFGIDRWDAEITLHWLSGLSGHLPVAFVTCVTPDAFGAGCASHPHAGHAAYRATAEATLCWSLDRQLVLINGGPREPMDADDVRSFDDHFLFHSALRDIAPILGAPTPRSCSTFEEAAAHSPVPSRTRPTLEQFSGELAERGHEPSFLNFGDHGDFGAGFSVCRALIPTFNAIDVDGRFPHMKLDRSRAALAAADEDYPSLYSSLGVTDLPHPMP